MLDFIKTIIAYIIKGILSVFASFIETNENQILFDSHNGRQYSCNPRAIYEKMIEKGVNYKYIWAFKNPENYKYLEKNPNTKICKYRSLKHFYYFAGSKWIISNVYKQVEYPIKNSQIFMQTWHGFPYKTIALARGSVAHRWAVRQHIKGTSVFTSCCNYFTEQVIKKDFEFSGNVLDVGMPRNDILINNQSSELYQTIKNGLIKDAVQNNIFIILYAPTYSETDQSDVEKIDVEKIISAVENRFQREAIFAFRGHHLQSNSKNQMGNRILDLTDYEDMQELLLVVDMLITDYSSTIWDFSFTNKPCFLFTPDIDQYRLKRGFEIDVCETGFPICQNNSDLINAIRFYDRKTNEEKIEQHHINMGSFERGTASQEVCNYICMNSYR